MPIVLRSTFFFSSVGRLWPGEAIGVLLTGMGADGAQGLKALRAKGHYTIAQDEASSAVYGMPKAAAAVNAAVEIFPLKSIAPKLVASPCASRPRKEPIHEHQRGDSCGPGYGIRVRHQECSWWTTS